MRNKFANGNRSLALPFGFFRALPVSAVLIAAGAVVGILTSVLPLMVTAVLFAGLLALLVTVARPDLALILYFCGVIMMTDDIPSHPVDYFYIPDADIIHGLPAILTTFFLLMLGITVARLMIFERRRIPVSLTPLGIYTAVLFLALATGLYRGTDHELLKVDFIGMIFPALCFYLCLLILDSRERIYRMLAVLLAVAAIKALILAVFYLAGRGWIYQLDNNTPYRITTMDSADLLAFITLLLIAVHLLVRKDIQGFKAGLVSTASFFLLFVIIFCYRRAQWVGLILSLGLIYLGTSKPVRKKIVLLVLAVLLLGSAVAVTSGLDQEKAKRITARLSSIFDKNQSSNVYHILESRQVLKDLTGSPLFGLGLGSKHSSLGIYENDEVPANVVHNTFLYIWMKTGLPGLLFFLWAAFLYARSIFRFRKEHLTGSSWGLLLPLAASSGLWLAMFLTAPVPWYLHQTGLIALFAAMGVTLIQQNGNQLKDERLNDENPARK